MRKIKILSGIYKGIISIIIPIVVFLSIFEAYAFCPRFYKHAFQRQDTAQKVGIKQPDLEKIIYKIFRYLKNKDTDINMQVSIHGKQMEVFGDREKRHMHDVKDLFQKGFFVRNIGLLIGSVFIFILWRISSDIRRDILQSCIGASLIAILMVLFLFAAVRLDFYAHFVYFHEIFFSNDLWILNPETDLLIQLFPLTFFMNMALRIIGWFGGLMSILGFFSYRLLSHPEGG